jgi:hypothetical protein
MTQSIELFTLRARGLGGHLRKWVLTRLSLKAFILFGAVVFILPCSYCQWENPRRLTNDPAASHVSYRGGKSIAVAGEIVHVVWRDYRGGGPEVYYKRSTDGGSTWSTDNLLAGSTCNLFPPVVETAGLCVYVLWSDASAESSSVNLRISRDQGVTWGSNIRLFEYSDSGTCFFPSIATDGSVVHVVWSLQPRNDNSFQYDLYYIKSSDQGNSWGGVVQLNGQDPDFVYHSNLVALGDRLCLTYMANPTYNGRMQIKSITSADAGTTWSSPSMVVSSSVYRYDPRISFFGDTLHLVWDEWSEPNNSNYHIYTCRSTDWGSTWTGRKMISDLGRVGQIPDIETSRKALFVAWRSSAHPGHTMDLGYSYSTDGGRNWQQEKQIVLGNDTASSPSVRFSQYGLHLTWRDNRDGNSEIYYMRKFLPDLDVYNRALDMWGNSILFEFGTQESATKTKKFLLVNSDFSHNPDPDGPGGSPILTDLTAGPKFTAFDKLSKLVRVTFSLPERLLRGEPATGTISINILQPKKIPDGLYRFNVIVRASTTDHTDSSSDKFIVLVRKGTVGPFPWLFE